jgi:hypothetical protein
MKRVVRRLAIGIGLAAGAYAALATAAWFRFGRRGSRGAGADDGLLDGFVPAFDIVERHAVRVRAPSRTTFEAALAMDLEASPVVRALVRARELALGARATRTRTAGAFIDRMRAIGWAELARVPGREVVMGAVTQPWEADVVFRPLSPDAFRAFDTPGFVKIAWTIRVDPDGDQASVFRTETRAVATDTTARRRFRRYWAFVSPGIVLIRWTLLGSVRRAAERLAAAGRVR